VEIHHAILCAALLLAAVGLSFRVDGVCVYHIGNSHTETFLAHDPALVAPHFSSFLGLASRL
jgi:hypothetical protein